MEAQAGMGLIKGHAYGILDVRKVGLPVASLECVWILWPNKFVTEQKRKIS